MRHQEAETNDSAAVFTIDASHANVVKVAVSPEDGAGHVVYGQCVGPGQVALSVFQLVLLVNFHFVL